MSKEKLVELIKSGLVDELNELRKSNSENVDLSESDFTGVSLVGADLSNIDLSGSDFAESNLQNVNLSNSDLTSANFARATLESVNFNDCVLNGTKFNNSTANTCDFSDSDLSGADLSEADLTNSDFSVSENLTTCRFDSYTIWPEQDKLPYDFDSSYQDDLAHLGDENEEEQDNIY